jgi:CheY-like chemotaxis protein
MINQQTILAAEDSDLMRHVTKRQLASLGAACEGARDGEKALQMWRREPWRYWLLIRYRDATHERARSGTRHPRRLLGRRALADRGLQRQGDGRCRPAVPPGRHRRLPGQAGGVAEAAQRAATQVAAHVVATDRHLKAKGPLGKPCGPFAFEAGASTTA